MTLPRKFDRSFDLPGCMVGIDAEASDDPDACVMKIFRRQGETLSIEKIWELKKQLTQEELDKLPSGTPVLIIWNTGSGPWPYVIRKYGGRAFAGNNAFPIGNVGDEPGRNTMVWLIARDSITQSSDIS